MAKTVTLTIDGRSVTVPEGTLVVNAAKKLDIDIPVFCYHPKMEPVGMCRMCLVEIGRPVVDRATGQPVLETDGTTKIQFGPKLETACTTPVSEGMVVVNTSDKVLAGRNDILEFLLTSHPLDCPTCQKGGECPLQNLTLAWGPGVSRFAWDEKMHLEKRYPLGELIYLDRERCIQCGRCVRFQAEIADDPVIAFSQRGRQFQIITTSEPGFDSYWSGNTTDICPVGALINSDYIYRSRPWEVNSAASICTQCPVGCNTTLNVRRVVGTKPGKEGGGRWIIERVMPRQNEWVNEIWICDKGRFGYHYAQEPERLTQPLVRKNGQLLPATWEEALSLAAERFRSAGQDLLVLAGGRLANEDLFNLQQLSAGLNSQTALYSTMAGGDLTAQVGLGQGTNFKDLGPETAILVIACDLEEEAPVWWLRIKQAADRGAKLIVLNPRPTKLDRYASHSLRYPYGAEAAMLLAMLLAMAANANSLSAKQPELPEAVQTIARSPDLQVAAAAFAQAQNGIVLYGSEGASLEASRALAQAAANLLQATGHVGRANNGLMAAWQRANDQGAWDLGFRPSPDLAAALGAARAMYIVAADPARDDPALTLTSEFLVVQDLFLTPTARLADVVLPAASFAEREGTFTSGERRVQRFYPGLPGTNDVPPDFAITGAIAQKLGLDVEARSAARVFARIAAAVTGYAGLSYQVLSQVGPQEPLIGRADLYYGGTAYDNHQGLGVQLKSSAEQGKNPTLAWVQPPAYDFPKEGLLAVPVTRLYDRGTTLLPSRLLHGRIPDPYIGINAADAARLGLADGGAAEVTFNGGSHFVTVRVVPDLPARMVLVPRSLDLPISGPEPVEVKAAEKAIGD